MVVRGAATLVTGRPIESQLRVVQGNQWDLHEQITHRAMTMNTLQFSLMLSPLLNRAWAG